MSAYLYALVSIGLWCLSGACFRRGSELMPPMLYLSLIAGGGAVVALAMQILRGHPWREALQLQPRVALAGFAGVALYTVMLALAFARVEAQGIGLVNLLNYLWPVWMVALQLLLLPGRFRPLPLVTGMCLGFGGLCLASGFSLPVTGWTDASPYLMALLGGFLWALYSVLLKSWKVPESQGGTTVHFASCAVIALVLHLGEAEASLAWAASWEAWSWILLGAVGPVGIAYDFWEMAVKRGNPSAVAAMAYFIPVGSSVVLAGMYRDAWSAGLIPGAVLITAGAALVRRAVRG